MVSRISSTAVDRPLNMRMLVLADLVSYTVRMLSRFRDFVSSDNELSLVKPPESTSETCVTCLPTFLRGQKGRGTRSEGLLDTELPMTTTFLLEDALSQDSGVLLSSSEFMRYILETTIPGVHYHHADDEFSSGAVAGSSSPPRLVDGAREEHMVPGYELQEWASDYAVLKILRDQENIPSTEKGELQVQIFHSKSLVYLERNWISRRKNLRGFKGEYDMLLNIADNVKALKPSNDPLPWDVLNMAKWKDSLWELIKEMKTVEERCSPTLLRAPGVYVLTTTPYSAFLRALAAEIADNTQPFKDWVI